MDGSGDLHVSTDAGITFTAVPDYTGETLGRISGLATHPTEPNTAFALFSFAERPNHLDPAHEHVQTQHGLECGLQRRR